ncbi:MAG TPA: hypothetical protein VFR15_15370 [Chloroflexia bacterium]|nr:hypothetical protein [Chloroflexia bacterium]
MLGRWIYRSRQFFGAAFARVSEDDMAEARRVLGPGLYEIFRAMPEQHRKHALVVYRRVIEAGGSDPALLQAALLHDSGKYDPGTGRYVTVVHRVAVVLLEALPGGKRVLRRLAAPGRGNGVVFYPFYLSRRHAAFGAMLAAQHGASPEVVRLIAGHHGRGDDPALKLLQSADEES